MFKTKILAASNLPTLEEFIKSPYPNNSYIKYKTIESYYRKGPAVIDGQRYNNVLTRANTTNKKRASNISFNENIKSTGLYRELDNLTMELAEKYGFDGVYIEGVLNDFLGKKLLEYGYKKVNDQHGADNYFKPTTNKSEVKASNFEGNVQRISELEGVKYDQEHGLGQVPDNQNVKYLGFAVQMSAYQFLKLAANRDFNKSSSVEHIMEHIKNGGAIGSPFLSIDMHKPIPEVKNHEGRTRVEAISRLYGKTTKVLVHVFLYGGDRAHHITLNDIARAHDTLMGELIQIPYKYNFSGKVFFQGKWQDIHDVKPNAVTSKNNIEAAFNQPYDFKWKKLPYNVYQATIKLPDDSTLVIEFEHDDSPSNKHINGYGFSFKRTNSKGILSIYKTGGKDAFRIFATVALALKNFIKGMKPGYICFSASESSRIKLYRQMLKLIAKQIPNYEMREENIGVGTQYAETVYYMYKSEFKDSIDKFITNLKKPISLEDTDEDDKNEIQSALISVPPKVLDEVMFRIKFDILWWLRDNFTPKFVKEYPEHFKEFKKEVTKLGKPLPKEEEKHEPEKGYRVFKIKFNTEGLPPNYPKIAKNVKKYFLLAIYWNNKTSDREEWEGAWDEKQNALFVYLYNNLTLMDFIELNPARLPDIFNHIKEVVIHELRHVVQSKIFKAKDPRQVSKLDKYHDNDDRDFDDDYYNSNVEFDPQIGTVVYDFILKLKYNKELNKILKLNKKFDLAKNIKSFVGAIPGNLRELFSAHSFFKALKEKNKINWNKAVRKFYVELMKELNKQKIESSFRKYLTKEEIKAGLIKIPPKLLNDTNEFVLSYVLWYLRDNFKTGKYPEHSDAVNQQIKKLGVKLPETKFKVPEKGITLKVFKFSTKGLPKNYPKASDKKDISVIIQWHPNSELNIPKGVKDDAAIWFSERNTLVINLYNIGELDLFLDTHKNHTLLLEHFINLLKEQIKHELRHAIQTKVLHQKDPKQIEQNDTYYTHKMEFDPQIGNAVNQFVSFLKISKELSEKVDIQHSIKTFVGAINSKAKNKFFSTYPLFKALKKADKIRWRLAVRKFYVELMKELNKQKIEAAIEIKASLGVVYHSTSLWNLHDILDTGKIRLSTSLGSASDKATNDYPYFLSLTRSKIGGYHTRAIGNYQAIIALDYDSLRANNKIAPRDYWGPEFRKTNQKINEMEETLVSKNQFIELPKPVTKLIKGIFVLFKPEENDSYSKPVKVRKTLLLAKRKGIPIYVYDNEKNWLSQRPEKAIPIKDLLDRLKGVEESNINWPRRNYFDRYLNIYYAPTLNHLSKDAKALLYKLSDYYVDEAVRSLEADLHNARSNKIAGPIVKLISKHGGVRKFIEYLAHKFDKEKVESSEVGEPLLLLKMWFDGAGSRFDSNDISILKNTLGKPSEKFSILYRAVKAPYLSNYGNKLNSWTPDRNIADRIGKESSKDYTILEAKNVPVDSIVFTHDLVKKWLNGLDINELSDSERLVYRSLKDLVKRYSWQKEVVAEGKLTHEKVQSSLKKANIINVTREQFDAIPDFMQKTRGATLEEMTNPKKTVFFMSFMNKAAPIRYRVEKDNKKEILGLLKKNKIESSQNSRYEYEGYWINPDNGELLDVGFHNHADFAHDYINKNEKLKKDFLSKYKDYPGQATIYLIQLGWIRYNRMESECKIMFGKDAITPAAAHNLIEHLDSLKDIEKYLVVIVENFSVDNIDNRSYKFNESNYKIMLRIINKNAKAKHMVVESAVRLNSKTFQKWFRGSKIVDKNGNPLLVYHGTSIPKFKRFKEPTSDIAMDGWWYGKGFYFTPSLETADMYSKRTTIYKDQDRKPRVEGFYLKIKNPYIIEVKLPGGRLFRALKEDFGQEIIDYMESNPEFKKQNSNPLSFAPYIGADFLKKKGYDGVIAYGNSVIDKSVKNSTEIVAFYPTQIISAGDVDPEVVQKAYNKRHHGWDDPDSESEEIKSSLIKANVIPCGDCFNYAFLDHITRKPSTLVHAIVQHPHSGKKFYHAWTEDDNKVYDWQTMKLGMSKYAGQGWPKDEFYSVYKPNDIKKYPGSVGNFRSKFKHTGPWENEKIESSNPNSAYGYQGFWFLPDGSIHEVKFHNHSLFAAKWMKEYPDEMKKFTDKGFKPTEEGIQFYCIFYLGWAKTNHSEYEVNVSIPKNNINNEQYRNLKEYLEDVEATHFNLSILKDPFTVDSDDSRYDEHNFRKMINMIKQNISRNNVESAIPNNRQPHVSKVKALIPKMVKIAQKVYDEWEQDEEGFDEELGSGGICHLIAEKIVDILMDAGVNLCTTYNSSIGENHVWVFALLNDGVYEIDIPPGVYESGGGYNWKKHKGVKFEDNHVIINQVSSDISPKAFSKNYIQSSYNSVISKVVSRLCFYNDLMPIATKGKVNGASKEANTRKSKISGLVAEQRSTLPKSHSQTKVNSA